MTHDATVGPLHARTQTPFQPRRRDVLVGVGAAALAGALVPGTRRAVAEDAPASSAPQQGAGFYRFSVGDITCYSIGDSGMAGKGSAYPLFGANATKDEVDALTLANFIPPETNYSYFNVLLIQTAKDLVLVDTGFGEMVGAAGGWLTRAMANAGFKPADVTKLVFSHLHPDHFGGYRLADGSPRFANAQVYLHAKEREFWAGDAPDLSKNGVDATMRGQMVAGAKATLGAIGDRLTLTKHETEVAPGVTIEDAPGHTPGHQMVRVRSGKDDLVMMADLAHHFAISLQRPHWHVAYDTDPAQGAATRRSALSRLAADKVMVMGYHMPWPGVGHVRASGDAFEWIPSPWQW